MQAVLLKVNNHFLKLGYNEGLLQTGGLFFDGDCWDCVIGLLLLQMAIMAVYLSIMGWLFVIKH
jgi:hypothetical protein